jgi:hypothetical protein
MKDAKDVKALCVDTGIFPHIARRLAREFDTVWYWTPWESAFPRLKDSVIGDGYPDIIACESIEEVKAECDLFVFPDIGYSDLQEELVKQGKAVWGCRRGDELEARRGKFLEVLGTTNLPVPKFKKVMGITSLKLFLKDKEDQYIKVSTYRGDFETTHFRSMAADESVLDKWAVTLGPLREYMNFFVFEPIDTEIEDGIDSWCIDGQWPETIIHGMECKDSAYIGAFQKLADCPEEIRVINEEFGPILKKYGYRGAFSTEGRITKDGETYFIDPTCRFPSPPSQCMCEMIGNLGEVIWKGANGEVIEPEQSFKFGAQAIFKVDRDEWGVFEIQDELDQWVKIAFSCKVDGKICVPPDQTGVEEIGWVVGVGDTMEEAIEHLRENKDAMPDGCNVQFSSIADLLKEIQTAEELGMSFTEGKIPGPETVVSKE